MLGYNYHPETGEYLGSSALRESPLEPGVWLVPAHATMTAPPLAQDGFAVCWAGNAWAQVEDHRGEELWTLEGGRVVIVNLGPVPGGLLDSPPPPTPAQVNAEIDAQIISLEARQARPLREVALGLDGAVERLAALDAQIAALRAQRV